MGESHGVGTGPAGFGGAGCPAAAGAAGLAAGGVAPAVPAGLAAGGEAAAGGLTGAVDDGGPGSADVFVSD